MADNKSDDGVWLFLFLVVVFWGGGYLLWKNFKPQITEGIVAVRNVEMKFSSLWLDDNDTLLVPMPKKADDEHETHVRLGDEKFTEWMDTKFGVWKHFAATAKPSDVQSIHLHVITYVAMAPLRWIFVACFGVFFFWVMFTGPTSKFRRVMGLEALMIDQAKTFKVIRPFLKFNPNTLPIRPPGAPVPTELGLFAEALNPEEWIAFNEIEFQDSKLDRAACEDAFAKQLGPRWKGVDALAPELKILLAAFALKAARQRNEADELLGRLSCCWDHVGGLKLSRDRKLLREAKKILRNKKLSEKTIHNCNRHAYISTALVRALNTAREDGGVLASAQFVWLRAHNRGLWYPLNNLGRQSFHLEALGVMSHYRAEKQINRPIPRPRVTDAVDGLAELMSDPLFARPIPPVDYGKTGKRRKKTGTAISNAA